MEISWYCGCMTILVTFVVDIFAFRYVAGFSDRFGKSSGKESGCKPNVRGVEKTQ